MISVLVSNSIEGKYSAVMLSIRLIFVDLHVMILHITAFYFLRSKRLFSREFPDAA